MLCTLILAGSVAPVVWLNPLRYFQEKRALREILRQHPTIRLLKLEVAPRTEVVKSVHWDEVVADKSWSHGLVLEVSAPTDDNVRALQSFSRSVRQNPILERTFEKPDTTFLNGGWQVYDPSEPPYPPLDVRFLFIPKAK
jgi:hypothetical protein